MKRIVTGRGDDGRDAILSEDGVKPVAGMPGSKNETRLFWSTSGPIQLPHDGSDPAREAEVQVKALGDSRFVFVTFPPGAKTPIHATQTTDFVVVVDGELWLVMENGDERIAQIGDAIIQNGTKHAWENRSDAPCTIAAVMIGAELR
jgi:quercetin dioxygenase-like cupin family protein